MATCNVCGGKAGEPLRHSCTAVLKKRIEKAKQLLEQGQVRSDHDPYSEIAEAITVLSGGHADTRSDGSDG